VSKERTYKEGGGNQSATPPKARGHRLEPRNRAKDTAVAKNRQKRPGQARRGELKTANEAEKKAESGVTGSRAKNVRKKKRRDKEGEP